MSATELKDTLQGIIATVIEERKTNAIAKQKDYEKRMSVARQRVAEAAAKLGTNQNVVVEGLGLLTVEERKQLVTEVLTCPPLRAYLDPDNNIHMMLTERLF